MTLKNNIKFTDWEEANNCAKVLFRLPQIWNADIQQSITTLFWKIHNKEENEDGTVRIRLKKDFTEYYGRHIAEHIKSVDNMYKTEFSEAFKKLFI